ncbi:hypothetical protein [Paludisphaera mucosa]|uniref:PH domain-containing protein n=1 Tax=Paludisphaera mucosa TaxID=3030827 RepID=A0ABT6FEW1_9BACT|nr:hypothetical protein [Paludisphaera mucosa]MDG3006034.1 hypothetical protein [Paludisphaera mucosa]
MDATYRPPRSKLYLGLGLLVGFLAWGGVGLWAAYAAPDVRNRPAAAALFGGVPLVMAGLSLAMVLENRLASLTFRGHQVVAQGSVRRAELDLTRVVEARWRTGPAGVRLVARAPSSRLVLNFRDYDPGDRDAIVGRIREAIRPDVQSGWNLFAHKTGLGEGGPRRTTPGPGEILATRARWTRIFVPALLATALVAVVSWRATGNARTFAIIPLVAVLWAVLRAVTPSEGSVERVVPLRSDPDLNRYDAQLLAWGVAAILGAATISHYQDRLSPPRLWTLAIAGFAAWFAGLFSIANRHGRRTALRDQEAAERAARERVAARG